MEPVSRLYVPEDLSAGCAVALSDGQCHYLRHVLRAGPGQSIVVFNGRQGAWEATLEEAGRRRLSAVPARQLGPQTPEPDLWLAFAPIKGGRVESMVEKATELGVSRLIPILTRRTVVRQVNAARLAAHAVEAAEQSERLSVPQVEEALPLERFLAMLPEDRHLIFCDESGGGMPIAQALAQLGKLRFAIVIGPEGGFSEEERRALRAHPRSHAVGLGPRVLRADTAAFAALACVQALSGDWDSPPRYKDPDARGGA